MKKTSSFFLLMAGAMTAFADPSSDIPTPQKRSDTVGFAKTLLAPGVSAVQASDGALLKNPFNPVELPPPVTASNNVPDVAPAQNEHLRLEAIAPKVTPSGSVKIGGEAYLLFGQKRLKVGDHLSIIFEGHPYELELSGIQSTSFTLRLNGVEITRPIKSVK